MGIRSEFKTDLVDLVTAWHRLLCGHKEVVHQRNIYGDEINMTNSRSVWKCVNPKCNKLVYKPFLYNKDPA